MTTALHTALDRLIRPRSIAIVGASTDPTKTAGRPLRYLRKHGFAGPIYPINPRIAEIDGLRCYPSVADLPDAPDAAIVLVGPERATEAVGALSRLGTAAAVVLAGGYAEVGGEGGTRQQALRTAAGAMRVLGPNTVGLVNLVERVTLAATSALEIDGLERGRIGVVSQSGGIMGSILSRAAFRGISMSRLIATGNEADLEVADFIEYLIDDPETSVITLYLEGLRNPDRFRRAALAAAQAGKPIVAYKVGRSEAGGRATVSHTGALAGEDRIYDALFEQSGVIRVERYSDLIDVPMALMPKRRLGGTRLAVLTTTGGAGALLADACGLRGFDTPAPSSAMAAKLAALLSDEGFVADHNPIDLTLAGLSPAVLRGAITGLMASDEFDAVLSVVGSSGLGQPELVAKPAIEIAATATKPLLIYVSPSAPDILRHLNRGGVPAFDAPESCAAALDALRRAALPVVTGESQGTVPPVPSEFAMASGALNEAESKRLFAAFGVPSVRESVVQDAAGAAQAAPALGERVVLKILSRDLAHKSEIGGVSLGVPLIEVAAECDRLARIPVAREGFLVQEQITGGVEFILGFVRDPQLGPAILLGAGGVLTELYADTVIRLLPIIEADVAVMIDRLVARRLLFGFRGKPRADVAALTKAVLCFARMCESLGDRLIEAEINPLFVLADGQGVKAADGVVRLR